MKERSSSGRSVVVQWPEPEPASKGKWWNMEPSRFQDDVRDVLAHLYDRLYLQTHPLAVLPVSHRPGELGGHALQRALIEAIDALKPAADVPYDSLPWRKYRYLYLRFVQGLPVPEVAGDLGISLRQSRRYARESLAAVADILRDRYRREEPKDRPRIDVRESEATPRNDAEPEKTPLFERKMGRLDEQAPTLATPVGELVAGVFATIEPLAKRRGITVRTFASSDATSVGIERTVLRQALLSVLSLSLDLTSVAVELALATSEEADNVTILIQAELGESPSQAIARMQTDERLLLARRLIEPNGGTLDLRLRNERWSSICLNVRTVRERTVLVVEDNPDTVELYRRYLDSTPFQIVAVSDGSQALTRAEATRPAVILLDVMMPSRDGWEILQMLKSRAETESIPVVVCSVLKERELALALGAVELLIKPVGRLDLLRALDRQCHLPAAACPSSPADSASGR